MLCQSLCGTPDRRATPQQLTNVGGKRNGSRRRDAPADAGGAQ
ncbi:Uncharacterized protein ChrSV_0061 [Chromobacterium vaccinii]|nr:Uncharacterized protein ChrSW_0061 [Chromobacterium vaccinii]QND87520.1 Uncharacterized protein ChrSV_0061 [Chromobacterium vaccinii]